MSTIDNQNPAKKTGDTISAFASNIVWALASAAFTVLVLQMLAIDDDPTTEKETIGFIFQTYQTEFQIIAQLLAFVFINGIVVILCYVLPRGTQKHASLNAWFHGLMVSARVAALWAFVNYVVWGVFAIFVIALSEPIKTFPIEVIVASAVIGSMIHYPICYIGYYYIGDRILENANVHELYDLDKHATARLVLPNGFGGVGIGIFFAYFAAILPHDSVVAMLYHARYNIIMILFIWTLMIWLFMYHLSTRSFTVRALKYKNIIVVWTFCICSLVGGALVGTELFQRVISAYLMTVL